MAAQIGSALLIKSGDGASPEVFTTIAGLRTKSISINGQEVDITNSDSSGKMRELLAGAGVQSVSISGSGVFLDGTPDQTLLDRVLAATLHNYEVTIPDFNTLTGLFLLTQLDYEGEHDGEVTYSMSLESGGVITAATI